MDEDAVPSVGHWEPAGNAIASPDTGQRAGDADREQAVALLREATVEGRLTLEEFSARVELALQARTHDELQELQRDLTRSVVPAPPVVKPQKRWVVTSRLERRGRWQLPADYRVNTLCGTVVLDLGQAVVQAAETTLHVRNLFGTTTIVVPEAIRLEIDDGGLFLTNEVSLPDQPPPPTAPLIRISTSGVGGTNYIRTGSQH